MAGGFDGLAETWSTRSIFLFFLPVGEALGHPRLCGGDTVVSGCCGLGVWGSPPWPGAHYWDLVGEAAARGLPHPAASLDTHTANILLL